MWSTLAALYFLQQLRKQETVLEEDVANTKHQRNKQTMSINPAEGSIIKTLSDIIAFFEKPTKEDENAHALHNAAVVLDHGWTGSNVS